MFVLWITYCIEYDVAYWLSCAVWAVWTVYTVSMYVCTYVQLYVVLGSLYLVLST